MRAGQMLWGFSSLRRRDFKVGKSALTQNSPEMMQPVPHFTSILPTLALPQRFLKPFKEMQNSSPSGLDENPSCSAVLQNLQLDR